MARNHIELISGGLAVVLEGGIASDARLLSTVPISSFAGLALALMPWLLSGGTLHLHHAFESLTFGAQRDATDFDRPSARDPAWRHQRAALRDWRDDGNRDVRSGAGALLLRVPMVPAAAFPRSAQAPHLSPDRAGYFDTGYSCRRDASNQTLAITVPRPNIVSVGGYRVRQNDLDACLEKAAPGATVVALPDCMLGQRLAGAAQDKEAVAAALEAARCQCAGIRSISRAHRR